MKPNNNIKAGSDYEQPTRDDLADWARLAKPAGRVAERQEGEGLPMNECTCDKMLDGVACSFCRLPDQTRKTMEKRMTLDDARYHVWLALGVLREVDGGFLTKRAEELLHSIDMQMVRIAKQREECRRSNDQVDAPSGARSAE